MNNEDDIRYNRHNIPPGSPDNPYAQPSVEELKAKHLAQTLDFVHRALSKPRNADESFSLIRSDFSSWYESEAMLDSLHLTDKDKLYAAWLAGAVSAIRRTK